ncbi:MAG: membrane protein insertase YidC [Paludibacteraceae bacterium]|nr:membrane protein insertase YidC [Paludibacteraceae bacterium]
MDKHSWIGLLLIAAIIVGFSMLNRPSKEEMAERQRINDSIRIAQQMEMEAQHLSDSINATISSNSEQTATDTIDGEMLYAQLSAVYGPFTPAAQGEDKEIILENDKLRLHIAAKGGRIAQAELKEYKAYGDTVNPLTLFRADESDMSFTLITSNNRILTTRNLYFEPIQPNAQNVIMRLKSEIEDAYIDFVYTLPDSTYMFDFQIVPHNANLVLAQNMNSLEMQWRQLIPQQERGRKFEERYAHLQYMTTGLDQERMSEAKHDTKRESGKVRWIGYKDQFFSTILIANDAFSSCEFESTPQQADTRYIKAYQTKANLAFDIANQQSASMRFFMGPNNYNLLKSYDDNAENELVKLHLQEIVLQGWRVIIWINQIFSFPVFDWLLHFGLPIGIVILLMTLIIKLIILPFVFASYRSSAKMRVLKPQMDEINAKYPAEKMQERQKAIMELYNRAGVSPMSGCLPMLFQMPILMAMFWFFPIAIELRGQSLWWADDLSAYDAILTWGTPIPLFGDHLSLFCLIMTVANLGYTIITMQSQATDPNMKFMKWMMYLMPIMFLFIFNDYAAGLSFYYTISLGFTILQTMCFRWAIDDKKLLAQMEANAKKKAGKPKSGFMARLEKMQQEQQRMARENAKAQAKKYR